ncbi:hypothetical protein C8R44DRAFT_803509 [Mycena epipterygia]|nr:hypothetical protein C8R44DRAFT_803509 [Mycena epipterygia]
MLRFLFWIGLASAVRAQTLQLVSPPQPESVTILESTTVSISALGVGSDGMTTYVEVGAETLAIEISGGVTQTLLSTPIEFTATFVEDASKFMIGTTDSGLFESCTFGADGQGSCVNQFVAPGGGSTLTTTFSGPVQPWYTLNAAASAITPPSSPTASVVTTPSSPTVSSKFSTSPSPTNPPASQTAGSGSSATPTSNAGISSQRWSVWAGAIVFPVLLHTLY